jgi:hypothetical protein
MFRVTVESSGVWISTDMSGCRMSQQGTIQWTFNCYENLVKISSLGAFSYGQMERPTIVRSMRSTFEGATK